MVYYPAPINQFNRLVRVSGSQPTGSYVFGDPWNNIHNGIDWDSRNCTAAIGAVLRDAWTGGKQKSSPNAIRNHQNDWSGGIGWDDVNVAWWDLYGERFTIPPSADWYDVLNWLKQGKFVGIQGDYDAVPYDYKIQKNGTFDHAFGLGGYRYSDARVLLYDPLGKNARWVPQYVIRPAAEKLALAQRGTRSRLFIALSRTVPQVVTPTTGYKVSIRPAAGDSYKNFWTYTVGSTGRISGRTADRSGGFTAICSAPSRRYWSQTGDYYTLVKIVDPKSSRYGKWVPARYAVEI